MRRPFPDGPPPSVRDFMAFEEHVRNARGNRGLAVPEAWYEIPVFYFSNPAAVYGDDEVVPKPSDTSRLDYELELACVIGSDGRPEGFTIMNDWSARDLQDGRPAPESGKAFLDDDAVGDRHLGRVRAAGRPLGRNVDAHVR